MESAVVAHIGLTGTQSLALWSQSMPSPLVLDPLFSIEQTAGLLNLGKRTVWRMISEGKIKAVKQSVRRTGIPASEIQRLQQPQSAAA